MYERMIRCKWLGDGCETVEELAVRLEGMASTLRAMAKDGVRLEAPMEGDYATLVTDAPSVAKKYNFEEEEAIGELQ